MPLTCSICSNPQRGEIEAAIVGGVSSRIIASQFSVGYGSVGRHKRNCMSAAIGQAQASQQVQTAQVVAQAEQQRIGFTWNAANKIEWLDRQATIIYAETRAEKDHNASLKALSEIRQQTKLFSELLSGMEPGQKEKMEEEWLAIREAIFKALEPYPEARLATARALIELGREKDGSDSTLSSDELG